MPRSGSELFDLSHVRHRGGGWKPAQKRGRIVGQEISAAFKPPDKAVARKLKQQTEWRMELLDGSQKPLFRISVLAETLDRPGAANLPAGNIGVAGGA